MAVTKISDVLDIYINNYGHLSKEHIGEIKTKLGQFSAQCLINAAIYLLPKVADKSELDFLTKQFLDFWSKHLCGEIDSIIK